MADRLRVAVVGASGYTGGELLRLLCLHPHVTIAQVMASDKSQGLGITSFFPNLHPILTLPLSELKISTLAEQADLVFLALPHTQSLELVADLLKHKKWVIDLSADFRLKNSEAYETWYQTPHTHPELLQEAVYGLPELHRSTISKSPMVAVPGCYPTAAILQMAPLIKEALLSTDPIIIDAKSGVSGAGRSPGKTFHFPEANEAIHAYKTGAHRHTPEIEQGLSYLSDATDHKSSPPSIIFSPHLIPINRGILSTAYLKLRDPIEAVSLQKIYETHYANEFFIQIFPTIDSINPSHLRGSNFCHIACTYDPRTGYVITTAAIDNLVKGAAGQAIQCMNLMVGFPETLGLTGPGLYP